MENKLKRLCIVWDLDGTLIDSSHRVRFHENGEFDLEAWYEKNTEEYIMKDSLLPLYELYASYRDMGYTQICVTARNMSSVDMKYLHENNLTFDMVLHREDSMDLDEVLKSKKLKAYFKEFQLIPFMAFDDKEENLKVFDSFGFRTFQAIYMNKKLTAEKFDDIKGIKPSSVK